MCSVVGGDELPVWGAVADKGQTRGRQGASNLDLHRKKASFTMSCWSNAARKLKRSANML